MRATLSYTTLRLAIFAVALGLLYLVGARGFLLLAVAALVSALLSWIVLARQRQAMAGSISKRITRVREGLDAGARAEDADEPEVPAGPAASDPARPSR
jgi:Mn2+/Fe2+ NRAMP family transporter